MGSGDVAAHRSSAESGNAQHEHSRDEDEYFALVDHATSLVGGALFSIAERKFIYVFEAFIVRSVPGDNLHIGIGSVEIVSVQGHDDWKKSGEFCECEDKR